MRYTLVLLDADGTLFDYRRAETFALERAFEDLGLRFHASYLPSYQEVNAQMWQRLERGEITQEAMRVARFREFRSRIAGEFDPSDMADRYLSRLATASFLIEGAAELVEWLSGRVRLAVITNGLKDVQRGRFAGSPLTPHFDDIIISEEVGCQKPDRRIFDTTLERLGHRDRSSALMVGDSLSSDIAGGMNAGIDTCWYNPDGGAPEGIHPVYTIRRLDEIPPIVGKRMERGAP